MITLRGPLMVETDGDTSPFFAGGGIIRIGDKSLGDWLTHLEGKEVKVEIGATKATIRLVEEKRI